MLTGLDHVQVAAPRQSEARARQFYGTLLGLEELAKPPNLAARGGAWFALGDGRQLHVGVAGDFAPAIKAHPAFRVRDLDALRARLETAGVATRDEEPLAGARRFYANDPFGNRLEFLEPSESAGGGAESTTAPALRR